VSRCGIVIATPVATPRRANYKDKQSRSFYCGCAISATAKLCPECALPASAVVPTGSPVKRREFIRLFAGAGAWPSTARA